MEIGLSFHCMGLSVVRSAHKKPHGTENDLARDWMSVLAYQHILGKCVVLFFLSFFFHTFKIIAPIGRADRTFSLGF
jgi:hypothetical protein